MLAASQPSLRPALQALCNATGCELSALRQIASITIDGASFSREKVGDGYRLDFTLRNGARMPLAMPAVELTLLDTEERAVVRRVLTPTQFGAPAVLGASAERAASLSHRACRPRCGGVAAGVGLSRDRLLSMSERRLRPLLLLHPLTTKAHPWQQ